MSDITLRPVQMEAFLKSCLATKPRSTAVQIWGPPGIGKTKVVQKVAAEAGFELITMIAAQADPTDIKGLPYVNGENGHKQAHWASPGILPDKRRPDGKKYAIFLDEFVNAPKMVMNSMQQMILEYQAGEVLLPDDTWFIMAGNRLADRAGAGTLTTAISSRVVHATMVPDLDQWCVWAIKAGIDPLVVAFVRFRTELFHKFEKNDQVFPCPRTWEFVSNIAKTDPAEDIALPLFAGAVGQGAAIEFMAFRAMYKQLVSVDAILLNPSKASIPTEPSAKYAVATAVGSKATQDNLGRCLDYLTRLDKEFEVMAIRDAITRDEEVMKCQVFTEWAVGNQDFVL